MTLQTNAAKNILWRSLIVIIQRSGDFGTNQNKGKSHMTQPTFKRPQPTNFKHNKFDCHGNYGGGVGKGASRNKGPRGQSKDAKANCKVQVSSTCFDPKNETGEEYFRQELRLLELGQEATFC
jgi:hypothetical protein